MENNTIITLGSFNETIKPRSVANNEDNARIIAKLAANRCTVADVKAFTETPEYRTLHGHVLRKFASAFYAKNGKPARTPEAPKNETPKPETPEAPKAPANDNAVETLKKALAPFIENVRPTAIDEETAERIERMVTEMVTEKVNAMLKAAKPSTIEVKIGENIRNVKGTSHYMLNDVLADLVNGENVYLYGAAGTGKTVLAKQAAEALGVPFYFTSKIDEVFQLTGFVDANGHYNETELYRCMQTGGLFLFDEMDASAPEALTAFNALLANGIMDFPNGKVSKPKNMYIIGAGNTRGAGGTAEYNTRQQIDYATLDRFIIEEIDYDPAIENAIGEGFEDKKTGEDAVDVVRVIRKLAKKNGLEIVMSYRTITRLGKLAAVKGIEKTVVSCIQNKLSEDDFETLKSAAEMKTLKASGNAFAMAICG